MDGQSPEGSGKRRVDSSRSTRAPVAATSWPLSKSPSRSPSAASRCSAQPGQRVGVLGTERPAAPLPQDGAQLVVPVEADAVVDAEDVPGRGRQQVAALAVGVVDHRVEQCHPPQLRVPAAHQPGHVDCLVDVDPQLQHAVAEGARAQHGRRHDRPARAPRRPGTRRAHERPACRRGSPRADAPPRSACTRRGRSRRPAAPGSTGSRCSRRSAGLRSAAPPAPGDASRPEDRRAPSTLSLSVRRVRGASRTIPV